MDDSSVGSLLLAIHGYLWLNTNLQVIKS